MLFDLRAPPPARSTGMLGSRGVRVYQLKDWAFAIALRHWVVPTLYVFTVNFNGGGL
jgi:hypothetical protein